MSTSIGIDKVIVQIFESPPPFGGVSITSPFDQQQITLGIAVSNTTELGLRWEYHPSIQSLTGPVTPTLNGFDFSTWVPGSIILVVVDPGTGPELQHWRVVEGPGEPDDTGQIVLDEFDAETNNKHLERVA